MSSLTKAQRDMLERIVKHGPLLEVVLTGSGGSASRHLNTLLHLGLVERIDHPSVMDASRMWPARAIMPTARGKDEI